MVATIQKDLSETNFDILYILEPNYINRTTYHPASLMTMYMSFTSYKYISINLKMMLCWQLNDSSNWNGSFKTISRHTVVCWQPKKPACQTRVLLTGRTIMWFSSILSSVVLEPNNFCSGNAGQCSHLTLQISTKLNLAFLRYKALKIGWFFLLLFIKVWKFHKTQMPTR